MEKHAYLIIANKNKNQLLKLISLLDDERNDIYLLIDQKSFLKTFDFTLNVKKSNLFQFSPFDIFWGDYTQIKAEVFLLEKATSKDYKFYHLLSGLDLPLVPQDEIHNFFNNHPKNEFLTFTDNEIFNKGNVSKRIENYHFFVKLWSRNAPNVVIKKIVGLYKRIENSVQSFLNVNRLSKKNIEIGYGSNWFSIENEFANYIVKEKEWIEKVFKYSILSDELFIHTILLNSKFKDRLFYSEPVHDKPEDFQGNLRYINWWDGNPKTWTINDYSELKDAQNRGFLFSRKFDEKIDSKIIKKISDDILRKQNETS